MKAVSWNGRRDVQVEEVPDPVLKEVTDARCPQAQLAPLHVSP